MCLTAVVPLMGDSDVILRVYNKAQLPQAAMLEV